MRFPIDITPRETERGFKIISFPSEYSYEDPIQCIALKVSESDYVIRSANLRDDDSRHFYAPHRWGVYRKQVLPSFHSLEEGLYTFVELSSIKFPVNSDIEPMDYEA
jgi:hypothetical protein